MDKKPNRLLNEKSPYLLQHAYNPVDWFAWGEEAFETARRENKPILLSVGYATCHWCHVMAHESFEDDQVARIMNDRYVSIKVDREERPDVDQVYMAACSVLTGQGGWPLTVFLTPEGRPFYAGTYFPKTSRYGRPGFMDLLVQLSDKWRSDREIVVKAADQLTSAIQDNRPVSTDVPGLGQEIFHQAAAALSRGFDVSNGGFGQAPKFPTPHNLNFLLRWHHRSGDRRILEMVEITLAAMRRGGIFDHVGLGFHRYSVDERWLVPHFEKMLYDQALLTLAYVETFQLTRKDLYARTAREIIEYVLRDMTSAEGAFYTAEDADSEGREGLFYVWKPEQIKEALGEELGEIFCRCYDITSEGNFEDHLSIPHVSRPVASMAGKFGLTEDELSTRLGEARQRLFDIREKRIHPLKDDKVITAWNGLMIAALAKAGQALDEPVYIQAAARAAGFILKTMKSSGGRLMRRFRDGETAHPGFLEDYAFFVWGLIELYQAGFDPDHLKEAVSLTRAMIEEFEDETAGGFFFTGKGGEQLVARKKETYDGAIPSGNSVAAMNLLRLGRMTGETVFEEKADRLLKLFAPELNQYPTAHTHLLMAFDFAAGPTQEAVIVGGRDKPETIGLLRTVSDRFLPCLVVLLNEAGPMADRLAEVAPFIRDMTEVEGRPAFYLCRDFVCRKPVTNPEDAARLLE